MAIKRLLFIAFTSTITLSIQAQESQEKDLMELQVLPSVRELGAMRRQPASVSLLDQQQLKDLHATTLKGVSTQIPNFFMPDYGSRQSSAVYIRGIGSRSNSPAVGLYVDDVPVLDKAAFDIAFYDILRMDVLRGPQSTLYGAGTMGGVMKVYTRSPFDYQGTDISMGYATRDNTRRFTFMHYNKPNEHFAWSFGGYYQGGDGYFRNSLTDQKVDDTSGGGIRLRAIAKTNSAWTMDLNASLEIDNDGAYPYYYMGRKDGKTEDQPDLLYRISNNIKGLYDRTSFRGSLNVSKPFPKLELRFITSAQTLNDSLQMDQDFLTEDIYKLTQTQKNLTLTEDVLLKSRKPGRCQWISGLTASYLHGKAQAPVTFREDGVAMLNGMINQNANANLPTVQAGPMSMQFNLSNRIMDENLVFDNQFTTRNLTLGAYHQSTLNDLFGIKGFCATLGLRFNAEMQHLDYASWYDFTHAYQLSGHLKTPAMERDVVMVPETEFNCQNGLYSSNFIASANRIAENSPLADTYLELLPKLALQYRMANWGNVYGSVSRGYRSGGYNLQNISEVMRGMMMSDMMQNVRDVTLPVLQNQPMVPDETKEKVTDILNRLAAPSNPDVQKACTYAPEYAWNYEVGAHLNLCQERLALDLSAFLSDIYNLQLTQMSETGLGRIMANAGNSRSAGMELALRARATQHLILQANYGYAHATFRDYKTGDSGDEYNGNYVPFMPQHTVNVDASYTHPLKQKTRKRAYGVFGSTESYVEEYTPEYAPRSLTFGATWSGAGRIYWTEDNQNWQNFYNTLSARITLDMHPISISLWGRNLTNSRHNTFWFISANRAYEQHCKPIQFGLDASISF